MLLFDDVAKSRKTHNCHCERSAAISLLSEILWDCFVAHSAGSGLLAMTAGDFLRLCYYLSLLFFYQLCSDAAVGKKLKQHCMPDPAVNNVRLCHAPLQRGEAAVDLGDHSAADRA